LSSDCHDKRNKGVTKNGAKEASLEAGKTSGGREALPEEGATPVHMTENLLLKIRPSGRSRITEGQEKNRSKKGNFRQKKKRPGRSEKANRRKVERIITVSQQGGKIPESITSEYGWGARHS